MTDSELDMSWKSVSMLAKPEWSCRARGLQENQTAAAVANLLQSLPINPKSDTSQSLMENAHPNRNQDEGCVLELCKVLEHVVLTGLENRTQAFMLASRLGARWKKYRHRSEALRYLHLMDVSITFGEVDEMLRAELDTVCASRRPSTMTQESRSSALNQVSQIIDGVFGTKPCQFGSSCNGFETESSDLDVTVPWQGDHSKEKLKELCNRLAFDGRRVAAYEGVEKVEIIDSARVPVVRVYFKNNPVHVDVTFGREVGVHNSKLLRAYADMDSRVRDLGVLIKTWAKARGIGEAKDGTLSSYAWCLMVIHYCQQIRLVPDLQHPPESALWRPLPKELVDDEHNVWFFNDTAAATMWLGQDAIDMGLEKLLRGFFDYFTRFDFYFNLVSIGTAGEVCSKADRFTKACGRPAHELAQIWHADVSALLEGRGAPRNPTASNVPAELLRWWEGTSFPYLSIEDPFEAHRVLCPSEDGQELICKEFKRALEIFQSSGKDVKLLQALFQPDDNAAASASNMRVPRPGLIPMVNAANAMPAGDARSSTAESAEVVLPTQLREQSLLQYVNTLTMQLLQHEFPVTWIPPTFQNIHQYCQAFEMACLDDTRASLLHAVEMAFKDRNEHPRPNLVITLLEPTEKEMEILEEQGKDVAGAVFRRILWDWTRVGNQKVRKLLIPYTVVVLVERTQLDDKTPLHRRSHGINFAIVCWLGENIVLQFRPGIPGVQDMDDKKEWALFTVGTVMSQVRIAQAVAFPRTRRPCFWRAEVSCRPYESGGASEDEACRDREHSDSAQHGQHCSPDQVEKFVQSLSLNPSQAEAVVTTFMLPSGIQLVQGPPGTGKTGTEAKLLLLMLLHQKRVLTVAPTNRAILEVLERTMSSIKDYNTQQASPAVELSQVCLVANEDQAGIYSYDHALSQALLDHRVERIMNAALRWRGLQMERLWQDPFKLFEQYKRIVNDGIATSDLLFIHLCPWLEESPEGFQRRIDGEGCRLRLRADADASMTDDVYKWLAHVLLATQRMLTRDLQQAQHDLPPDQADTKQYGRSAKESREKAAYDAAAALLHALQDVSDLLEEVVPAIHRLALTTALEGAMEIQVNNLAGKCCDVRVDFDSRVRDLKHRLQRKLGIASNQQKLLAGQTLLNDTQVLQDVFGNARAVQVTLICQEAVEEVDDMTWQPWRYLFGELGNQFGKRLQHAWFGQQGFSEASVSLVGGAKDRTGNRGGVRPDLLKAAILARCHLVFCTTTVAGRPLIEHQHIDFLAIDEAAMCVEAELIISLRKHIRSLVMFGDPEQLPATVLSRQACKMDYNRSLFERIADSGHPRHMILEIQYRMPPAVVAWPNMRFYKDRIETAEQPRERCQRVADAGWPRPAGNPEAHQRGWSLDMGFLDASKSQWEEMRGEPPNTSSWRNPGYARAILKFLSDLLIEPAAALALESIQEKLKLAIITPYRGQIVEYQKLLAERQYCSLREAVSLDVDTDIATVEGFQGDERDIVIVDTVRSNTRSQIGFLSDRRRLNVAITRARLKCWVVGNASLLGHHRIWADFLKFMRDRASVRPLSGLACGTMQMESLQVQTQQVLSSSQPPVDVKWEIVMVGSFMTAADRLAQDDRKKAYTFCGCLESGRLPRAPSPSDEPWKSSVIVSSVPNAPHLFVIWWVALNEESGKQFIKVYGLATEESARASLCEQAHSHLNIFSDEYLARALQRKRLPCGRYTAKVFKLSGWEIRRSFSDSRSAVSMVRERAVSGQAITMEPHFEVGKAHLQYFALHTSAGLSLPLELNEDERRVLENILREGGFIVARSGTGKTTVLSNALLRGQEVAEEHEAGGLVAAYVTKNRRLCVDQQRRYDKLLRGRFVASYQSSNGGNATDTEIMNRQQHFVDAAEDMILLDEDALAAAEANLPTTFTQIPDNRCEPYFLHFAHVLCMLDNEAPGEPFLRVERPGEGLQGRFQQEASITDEIWAARYAPKLQGTLAKQDSTTLLRKEILTVIKGSVEAMGSKNGYVSEEVYVNGCKDSSVSEENARRRYYAAYLKYEASKREFGHFDAADFVHNLERRLSRMKSSLRGFAACYVDEAQDLLPCELRLLRHLCIYPSGFVFAGDTAQTILKEVDFRFETVRALVYTDFFRRGPGCPMPRIPETQHLRLNMRCTQEVLDMASVFVLLLMRYFPEKIDKLEPETSEGIGGSRPVAITKLTLEEAIEVFFPPGMEQEFGAEQCLLVFKPHDRERMRKRFPGSNVHMVTEVKGLEYDDVFLFLPFDPSMLKIWLLAYTYLRECEKLEEGSPEYRRAPVFDEHAHADANAMWKLLYVAITRARKRVWIFVGYDKDHGQAATPMLKLLEIQGGLQVCSNIAELRSCGTFAKASSAEELVEKGKQYFHHNQYLEAERCWRRAGSAGEPSGFLLARFAAATGARATATVQASKQGFCNSAMLFSELAESLSNENPGGLLERMKVNGIGCWKKAATSYLSAESPLQAGEIYASKLSDAKMAATCFEQAQEWVRAGDQWRLCSGCTEQAAEAYVAAGRGGLEKFVPFAENLMQEDGAAEKYSFLFDVARLAMRPLADRRARGRGTNHELLTMRRLILLQPEEQQLRLLASLKDRQLSMECLKAMHRFKACAELELQAWGFDAAADFSKRENDIEFEIQIRHLEVDAFLGLIPAKQFIEGTISGWRDDKSLLRQWTKNLVNVQKAHQNIEAQSLDGRASFPTFLSEQSQLLTLLNACVTGCQKSSLLNLLRAASEHIQCDVKHLKSSCFAFNFVARSSILKGRCGKELVESLISLFTKCQRVLLQIAGFSAESQAPNGNQQDAASQRVALEVLFSAVRCGSVGPHYLVFSPVLGSGSEFLADHGRLDSEVLRAEGFPWVMLLAARLTLDMLMVCRSYLQRRHLPWSKVNVETGAMQGPTGEAEADMQVVNTASLASAEVIRILDSQVYQQFVRKLNEEKVYSSLDMSLHKAGENIRQEVEGVVVFGLLFPVHDTLSSVPQVAVTRRTLPWAAEHARRAIEALCAEFQQNRPPSLQKLIDALDIGAGFSHELLRRVTQQIWLRLGKVGNMDGPVSCTLWSYTIEAELCEGSHFGMNAYQQMENMLRLQLRATQFLHNYLQSQNDLLLRLHPRSLCTMLERTVTWTLVLRTSLNRTTLPQSYVARHLLGREELLRISANHWAPAQLWRDLFGALFMVIRLAISLLRKVEFWDRWMRCHYLPPEQAQAVAWRLVLVAFTCGSEDRIRVLRKEVRTLFNKTKPQTLLNKLLINTNKYSIYSVKLLRLLFEVPSHYLYDNQRRDMMMPWIHACSAELGDAFVVLCRADQWSPSAWWTWRSSNLSFQAPYMQKGTHGLKALIAQSGLNADIRDLEEMSISWKAPMEAFVFNRGVVDLSDALSGLSKSSIDAQGSPSAPGSSDSSPIPTEREETAAPEESAEFDFEVDVKSLVADSLAPLQKVSDFIRALNLTTLRTLWSSWNLCSKRSVDPEVKVGFAWARVHAPGDKVVAAIYFCRILPLRRKHRRDAKRWERVAEMLAPLLADVRKMPDPKARRKADTACELSQQLLAQIVSFCQFLEGDCSVDSTSTEGLAKVLIARASQEGQLRSQKLDQLHTCICAAGLQKEYIALLRDFLSPAAKAVVSRWIAKFVKRR